MDLKLDAAEVERLITEGFKAREPFFRVEELQSGFARTRLLFRPWMYRPGDVVSGPAMFSAADLAMYTLVLAHAGPVVMAVTSDLNMHFLSKGTPSDLICSVRLLKLGRRLAVMDVSIRCEADAVPCAHVTGTYALPSAK